MAAHRASMPVSLIATVSMTGMSLLVLPQLEHVFELIGGALRQRQIGLVDHEHVGDFEDAGFHRLHVVAHIGRVHHDADVGDLGDLDLRLAGADRFNDDDIAPGRIHHVDNAVNALRQAAEMSARRHRADEDAGIFRMPPHADAVAENGAAGYRAGRIDRGDGDCLPAPAQCADIGVDQSRFARTRRAGEADDRRAAGFGTHAPMDQVGGRRRRFP